MGILAERWRDIPEHPGYQASNLGRIRSVDRILLVKHPSGKLVTRKRKGRLLDPKKAPNDYQRVRIRKDRLTHVLVALTWIGPVPPRKEVNHKNGNKHDNRVSNLEYMTRRENTTHAYRNGLTTNQGETHYRAVLTEELVRELRKLPKSVNLKAKANQLGIAYLTVYSAVSRATWKHVKQPKNH